MFENDPLLSKFEWVCFEASNDTLLLVAINWPSSISEEWPGYNEHQSSRINDWLAQLIEDFKFIFAERNYQWVKVTSEGMPIWAFELRNEKPFLSWHNHRAETLYRACSLMPAPRKEELQSLVENTNSRRQREDS